MSGRDNIPKKKEKLEQMALVEWAAWVHRVKLVHVANEGKRSLRTGSDLKKMGLSKGFPDLMLLKPRKGFAGLFIEFKPYKGAYISPEQLKWLEELNLDGYKALVGWGFEDSQIIINDYLAG